ncbi:MAG: methyltransferase domain-containing protein [bacterium]
MVSKSKISQSFSKVASHYDKYAFLQRKLAHELIEKIKNQNNIKYILDIGSGTGEICSILEKIFPQAKIFGCDIAFGMSLYAQKKYSDRTKIFFQQSDAEKLPYKKNCFDLVISNTSFQWIKNIKNLFVEIKNVLKPNGKIYFTTFGKESLLELISFFDKNNLDVEKINICTLSIEKILKELNFCNIKITSTKEKIFFPDSISFLKWIKNIGSPSILNRSSGLFGKTLLFSLLHYYDHNFKENNGVYATFEVIKGEAEKNES